jgi:hypothetical protein
MMFIGFEPTDRNLRMSAVGIRNGSMNNFVSTFNVGSSTPSFANRASEMPKNFEKRTGFLIFAILEDPKNYIITKFGPC